MKFSLAIIFSHDMEILKICEKVGFEIEMKMEHFPDMAGFLLALQEKDYQAALFDCTDRDTSCLKWVKVIKKIRPKIPLIIFSGDVDRNTGGKIYDEGIFYLCIRPVRKEEIRNALSGAISSYRTHMKI